MKQEESLGYEQMKKTALEQLRSGKLLTIPLSNRAMTAQKPAI
jgi:hypothetical protein